MENISHPRAAVACRRYNPGGEEGEGKRITLHVDATSLQGRVKSKNH
jgi:hypothetical protein